jgi:hypothetical protein
VDVLFRDEKLARTCSSLPAITRVFGRVEGLRIARRLCEIAALATMGSADRLRHLRAQRVAEDDTMTIRVSDSCAIELQPLPDAARTSDGAINWDGVEEVVVTAIVIRR